MSLKEILSLVQTIIAFEAKIEELIKNEKDKRRRKQIKKAVKKRDTDALRKLLFDS